MFSEIREVEFIQDSLGKKQGETINLAYAHAQMVHKISNQFEHFATSTRSKYDGLKLKGLPYWGLQAHPEASKRFIAEEANVSDHILSNKVLNDSYALLEGFVKEL